MQWMCCGDNLQCFVILTADATATDCFNGSTAHRAPETNDDGATTAV